MRWLLVLSLLAAACDSEPTSSPDTAHLDGTVARKTLTPRSALARYEPLASGARGLVVVVSDRESTCTAMHTQSATSVTLSLGGLAPGTYAVVVKSPGSGDATAVFTVADQACKATVNENGTSGSINVKDVVSDLSNGTSRVRGSFNVVFADGTVTGDFDASLCGSGDGGSSGAACTP